MESFAIVNVFLTWILQQSQEEITRGDNLNIAAASKNCVLTINQILKPITRTSP